MQPPFDAPQWFVLRDLKRANAKVPGYLYLSQQGFEVFTPMQWVVRENPRGGRTRQRIPCIPSLLFARSLKADLDVVVARTDTLQYRFLKGAPQNTPMTVPTDDMERFMRAVNAEQANCTFYSPEEITPDMLGKQVRIVGGALDGVTGTLLKRRGARKKRILIEIKDMLAASIECEADFIQPL